MAKTKRIYDDLENGREFVCLVIYTKNIFQLTRSFRRFVLRTRKTFGVEYFAILDVIKKTSK